jgi:hypothetical protein
MPRYFFLITLLFITVQMAAIITVIHYFELSKWLFLPGVFLILITTVKIMEKYLERLDNR